MAAQISLLHHTQVASGIITWQLPHLSELEG